MTRDKSLMDGIRRVEANFFDEDLFNIWFHLTNLRWLKVANKEEVAEADRADRANRVDKDRVDRKKADKLDTVVEEPGTALENPALENPDIGQEDLGITLEDLILEDPDIASEDSSTSLEDPVLILLVAGDPAAENLVVAENSGIGNDI